MKDNFVSQLEQNKEFKERVMQLKCDIHPDIILVFFLPLFREISRLGSMVV
jgi:hypothetical protein